MKIEEDLLYFVHNSISRYFRKSHLKLHCGNFVNMPNCITCEFYHCSIVIIFTDRGKKKIFEADFF